MPLIAGPGALATMVLLSSRNTGDLPALVGINAVMLLVLAMTYAAVPGQPAWSSALLGTHRHRGADPAVRHPARGAVGAVRPRRAARLRLPAGLMWRSTPTRWARLVYLLLLLVFVGRLPARRGGTASDDRCATSPIWVLIFAMVVIAYGFRDVLRERAAAGGDGQPGRRQHRAPARASDGHFHAEALVNGVPVRFLVDTGASDIVLSRRGRRAGRDRPGGAQLRRPRPHRQRRGRDGAGSARDGRVRRLHRQRASRPASAAASSTSRCSACPTSTASPRSRSRATG